MLRPISEHGIFEHRIQRARAGIDLMRPGALQKLIALGGSQDPEPFEALAKEFPYVPPGFERRPPPEALRAAQLALCTGMDKAEWSIRLGWHDLGYEDPDRLSTGSLTLDYLTNGGLPRGMVTQFKGAESRGKTFAAQKTVAATIAAGGSAFWLAGERFNAEWARTLGVPILYSKAQISMMSDAQRQFAEQYNRTFEEDASRFGLIVGKEGNKVLNKAVEVVEQGLFDLVVVDSIAVLKMAGHLKTLDKETRGGEAKLINAFCAFMESAFNHNEHMRGRVTHKVKIDDKEVELRGIGARAAALVLNQLRDRGLDSQIKMGPDAGGGRGLRHTKCIDLEFGATKHFAVDTGTQPIFAGQRTHVECDKSKAGPPLRRGYIELQYATVPGLTRAGSYGLATELFGGKFGDGDNAIVFSGLTEFAGVVSKKGSHYYIGEGKEQVHLNGAKAVWDFFANPENRAVVDVLSQRVRQWIQAGGIPGVTPC